MKSADLLQSVERVGTTLPCELLRELPFGPPIQSVGPPHFAGSRDWQGPETSVGLSNSSIGPPHQQGLLLYFLIATNLQPLAGSGSENKRFLYRGIRRSLTSNDRELLWHFAGSRDWQGPEPPLGPPIPPLGPRTSKVYYYTS